MIANGGLVVARVEREKLEVYQRRYQQYIKTAKALHALESVQ